VTAHEAASALLRSARTDAGYTQADLAEHAGISVRTVSMLETGRQSNVRTDTLRAIADVLGIDSTALIAAYTGDAAAVAAAPAPGRRRGRGRRDPGPTPIDLTLLTDTIDAISRVTDAGATIKSAELRGAIDDLGPLSARLFTAYAHTMIDAHPGDAGVAHLITRELSAHPHDDTPGRQRLIARIDQIQKRRP